MSSGKSKCKKKNAFYDRNLLRKIIISEIKRIVLQCWGGGVFRNRKRGVSQYKGKQIRNTNIHAYG